MKTSVKKGLVLLSIASIFFIVSGYLINIWLGRYLGPEGYGHFGIIISLISLINLIQTNGITQAVSKFTAEDEENHEGILKTGLILLTYITLFLSLIFFLFSPILADLFNDPTLTPYIQLATLIFPFYGLYSLYSDYYNGLHYFKHQAVMNTAYAVAKVFLIIGLSFYFKLYGAIAGYILAPLIALIFGFRFPNFHVKTISYKKILFFSLPLLGYSIFYTLLNSIDLFFIKGTLSSSTAPGYYTASQNVSRILLFGVSSLTLVIYPNISRYVRHNTTEKIKEIIHLSLRLNVFLFAFFSVIISATSAGVIQIIYSPVYLPASYSLSILIFAYGFLTIFTLLTSILNGAGMSKQTMITAIVGVVITGSLCYLIIPQYELLGAAWATTIGSFIAMLFAGVTVYRRFHVLIPLKSVIKILFVSGIMYLIAKNLPVPPILLPLLYVFLFGLYLISLILLKEVTREDWNHVRGIIPSWVPYVHNL